MADLQAPSALCRSLPSGEWPSWRPCGKWGRCGSGPSRGLVGSAAAARWRSGTLGCSRNIDNGWPLPDAHLSLPCGCRRRWSARAQRATVRGGTLFLPPAHMRKTHSRRIRYRMPWCRTGNGGWPVWPVAPSSPVLTGRSLRGGRGSFDPEGEDGLFFQACSFEDVWCLALTCGLRFRVTPSSMPWASARVRVTLLSLATPPGDITRLWDATVCDRVVLGGRPDTERQTGRVLKSSWPAPVVAGICLFPSRDETAAQLQLQISCSLASRLVW